MKWGKPHALSDNEVSLYDCLCSRDEERSERSETQRRNEGKRIKEGTGDKRKRHKKNRPHATRLEEVLSLHLSSLPSKLKILYCTVTGRKKAAN